MAREQGLRDRKKAETRERIADVAAGLFAEHGYEAVSVIDVARAANVSDQTVYNYFPAKQDLVLDRVDEFLELYRRAVLERGAGVSPAGAIRPLLEADIERYRHTDPRQGRGEFFTQCVISPVLRRFALEFRERQIEVVADAIVSTCPDLAPLSATAHAAALVAVVQAIGDRIGAGLRDSAPVAELVAELTRVASLALDDLDRAFRSVTTPGAPS
ncbi:TetR/AcrR family transcriptional regulator [Cryptosporangium phraense]|uniref:TetR/AcrR family transcriptional regulator n=1 Tax=Cryptosporangium phraense TaxID=2593070 RepID=A0A545AZX8_9ACTN|nr:TetR/AcrR family transcriptional regulator [Cryptosporangium phraense]TQS46155.1 TetR/AcrR family transcriptional regulator [Cryptosporangium phraense]